MPKTGLWAHSNGKACGCFICEETFEDEDWMAIEAWMDIHQHNILDEAKYYLALRYGLIFQGSREQKVVEPGHVSIPIVLLENIIEEIERLLFKTESQEG